MGNEQGDEDNRGKPYQEKDEMKLWGIFVFALIGATATTFAVGSYPIFFLFFFVSLLFFIYLNLVMQFSGFCKVRSFIE